MKTLSMTTLLSVALMGSALANAQTALNQDCPAELRVGETFKVSLPTNAGTGYSWVIKQQSEHFKLLKEEYVSNNTSPGGQLFVGAPGEFVWHFETVQRGQAALKFDYMRPWMPQEVEKKWACQVVVK